VRAAALVLAGVTASCGAPTESPKAPPRVVFDSTSNDFGPVEQGRTLSHRFTLRNAGGSALRVDGVKSACDCRAEVNPTGLIAPGQIGSVLASCDTARMFGTGGRSVTVYTNDPVQPTTELSLSANVTADVAADPPEVYVGHAQRGQQLDVPLRIVTARESTSVGLRLAKPDGAVLHVSMPGPADQSGRPVRLAIRPNAPLGRFTETVTLDTSSARQPTVSVTVIGFVDGDLAPWPRAVRFGVVARNESAARDVIVRNHGDVPARIVGASLRPEVARAAIETVEDGREYRVRLNLSDSLAPGRVNAQLTIQTNRPDQAEIVLPVSATIREKR